MCEARENSGRNLAASQEYLRICRTSIVRYRDLQARSTGHAKSPALPNSCIGTTRTVFVASRHLVNRCGVYGHERFDCAICKHSSHVCCGNSEVQVLAAHKLGEGYTNRLSAGVQK